MTRQDAKQLQSDVDGGKSEPCDTNAADTCPAPCTRCAHSTTHSDAVSLHEARDRIEREAATIDHIISTSQSDHRTDKRLPPLTRLALHVTRRDVTPLNTFRLSRRPSNVQRRKQEPRCSQQIYSKKHRKIRKVKTSTQFLE